MVSVYRVFDPASYSKHVRDKFGSMNGDIADKVTSPNGSELDWVEPSLHLCNSRMLQPHGSDRVYDAFHLLQTEPSVQVPYTVDSSIPNLGFHVICVDEIEMNFRLLFSFFVVKFAHRFEKANMIMENCGSTVLLLLLLSQCLTFL